MTLNTWQTNAFNVISVFVGAIVLSCHGCLFINNGCQCVSESELHCSNFSTGSFGNEGPFSNVTKLIINGGTYPQLTLNTIAQQFPALKSFTISGCSISSVLVHTGSNNTSSLEAWSSLTRFSVAKNRLRFFPEKDLVSFLPNLQELNLSYNVLEELGDLAGFEQLTVLDVSRNYLQNLATNGLTVLRASNNRITHPQFFAVQSNASLEELDLSYNPLTRTLPSFPPMSRLKRLSLEGSEKLLMANLSSFSREHFPELRELSLAHSPQLQIVFGSVPSQLRRLNLKNCVLRYLPREIIRVHTGPDGVVNIDLSHNPLSCDCRLVSLIGLEESNLTCGNPPNLRGSTLFDAQTTLRENCSGPGIVDNPDSIDSLHSVGQYGEELLVPCLGYGEQPLKIRWSRFTSGGERPLFEWDEDLQTIVDLREDRLRQSHDTVLLPQGYLFFHSLTRDHIDLYKCTVISGHGGNFTGLYSVRLNYSHWKLIEIYSIFASVATTLISFVLNTLYGALKRFLTWRLSQKEKTSRVRGLLESLEKYRERQVEALHAKYTEKMERISANYHLQVEYIEQSYVAQMDRFRDYKATAATQTEQLRDNYYAQIARLREYGSRQVERLSESYTAQLGRIRTFSMSQRERLMRQYKIKQRYFDKVMKSLNLRDEYIDAPPGSPFPPGGPTFDPVELPAWPITIKNSSDVPFKPGMPSIAEPEEFDIASVSDYQSLPPDEDLLAGLDFALEGIEPFDEVEPGQEFICMDSYVDLGGSGDHATTHKMNNQAACSSKNENIC